MTILWYFWGLVPWSDFPSVKCLLRMFAKGYPGNLVASVTYRLAGSPVSSLAIHITATTDRPTVVNIR